MTPIRENPTEVTSPASASPPGCLRTCGLFGLRFAVLSTITASTVFEIQMAKIAQNNLNAPFFVSYVTLSFFIVFLGLARCFPSSEPKATHFKDAAVLGPLIFASAYFFMQAVRWAPPSLVQVIFGASPALVVLGARVVLAEALTVGRIVAVCIALAGAAMIGADARNADKHNGTQLAFGVVLAFIAVATASAYKVGFRYRLGSAALTRVLGFLAAVGVLSCIIGLPITLILSATGCEDRWWDTRDVHVNWLAILGTGIINMLYMTAVAYGVAVAGPILVAFSIILGSPISLGMDAVFRNVHSSPMELFGGALIVLSFGILSYAQAPAKPSCALAEQEQP